MRGDEPEFRPNSERWTDWGWPSQRPTDPYAFARYAEQQEAEKARQEPDRG